jgi:putative flippase GtrA
LFQENPATQNAFIAPGAGDAAFAQPRKRRTALHTALITITFLFYVLIGGTATIVNLVYFLAFIRVGVPIHPAAILALFIAAGPNYYLSVKLLFSHKAKWRAPTEALVYVALVSVLGLADSGTTSSFVAAGLDARVQKSFQRPLYLFLNFAGRRWMLLRTSRFPTFSDSPGDWMGRRIDTWAGRTFRRRRAPEAERPRRSVAGFLAAAQL